MNATYYATYEEACSGLTEEDGAYELEHKCRRPDFRRLFGPQCPHPSRTSGQKTTPLVDPVSDFEMCQSKCAATNHCCNNDPEQGSNQHLSCLQACMVVRSGVSGDECLSYCPQKKCAFDIGDARYVTCQTCDDVPAHAVRFGDKYKPAAYNCSAQYGSDEESCQAGCAAGVDSLAETAEEALDDSAEVSEVSSSAASSSDSEDALSSTAADIAIEDWFRDHVGLTGCMPEVPTGQPWYLTLWEKCHYNWVFHKRNAARCEGVTEARGCAELERHCLRLRFAEEYHDQCQGVLLAQQEEEMIENALAAQEADEPEDEPVDIVAAVNAAVDARLTEYGLLTEDGEVATEHISPAQMKVLAEKLDAVIENVTASETSVEEKVDATIAEHLREMVQKESAPAPPAPRAPLSSETELLDAIKKIVKEERLTPAESELVLQEAELFADAIAHGVRVDKIAMTLQAESESAACALAFSIMELDTSLGVCVAEVIVGDRRSALSLKSYHVTILLSPVTVPAPALEAALEKLADEGVTTMTTEIDPAAALEAAVPDADIPTLEPLLETFEAEAEAIVEAEEEEAKIEEARVTSSSVKYPAPGPIIAPSSPPPAPPAPLASETQLLQSVPAASAAEATFLADAVACGATVEKVSMTIQAESAAAACEAAFDIMQLDSSSGVCSASLIEESRANASRSRLRLARRALSVNSLTDATSLGEATLASYRVTILLSGDVVDAMALESALVHLAAEGITTMTTESDPADLLRAVAGVDEALVDALEEEVESLHEPPNASTTSSTIAMGPSMGPSVAPPLPPPAPLASETTLLQAVADAATSLDDEDGELLLAEAAIMADAIASGKRVDQISMTIEAADADAACAYAFAAMRIDPSLGLCEADVTETTASKLKLRRRSLSAISKLPSFDVSIILSPNVDDATLEAALKRLKDLGVATITTELNPVWGFEAVVPEGLVDDTLLDRFERDASAALDDKVRRVSDFTTAL